MGIEGFFPTLAADGSEDEVLAVLERLNEDPRVSGILLQLPTP